MRQLFQDHLDLRAEHEERLGVVTGADGVGRASVEAGHERGLVTIFGEVRVKRFAYRHKNVTNLYPADAALNLPVESYSHGLRELAAIEAARGSFDEAVAALARATAVRVPKRQVEAMAQAAAVDFEAFFAQLRRDAPSEGEVVVISADGKGVVMRPEGLRAATRAKAQASKNKLKGRLSARKPTANAWPKSVPSTPSPPSPELQMTSWPTVVLAPPSRHPPPARNG